MEAQQFTHFILVNNDVIQDILKLLKYFGKVSLIYNFNLPQKYCVASVSTVASAVARVLQL